MIYKACSFNWRTEAVARPLLIRCQIPTRCLFIEQLANVWERSRSFGRCACFASVALTRSFQAILLSFLTV